MRAMEYTPCVQECECVELDDLMQVAMVSGLDFASTRLTHGCPIHGLLAEIQSRQKHLTDAECAAEYWRAMYDVMTMIAQDFGYQATPQPRTMREVIRWGEVANRFVTYPHASEVEQ